MTEPVLPYRVYSRDILLGEASSLKLQKDEIDMTAVFQIANGEGGSEANRPLKLEINRAVLRVVTRSRSYVLYGSNPMS
jgi:hypothetical protein